MRDAKLFRIFELYFNCAINSGRQPAFCYKRVAGSHPGILAIGSSLEREAPVRRILTGSSNIF
jgi:hypothetical protein